MSNVLSEQKKQQVIALGRLGWTLRRIEKATGIRRETAGAYLREAGIETRPPGRWGKLPAAKPAKQTSTDPEPTAAPRTPDPSVATAKPANEVSTDFGATLGAAPDLTQVSRSPTASACEPYRETIEQALARGRNAMAIWQDLVTAGGFPAGYASVKRFVHQLRGTPGKEAFCVITTGPGEEAQVDYGTGPMVRDAQSGKYRRTRLFVLTLGYSRKSVRLLLFRSSSQTWAALHEQAFARLGGTPQFVVLDNLREGVLAPDIYDPTINLVYRDMLTHYGVVAMPCRVRDPNRKGKVESGVAHAQNTPLKGLRFETLQEAQLYLDQWEQRWADTRIHGTTKRQVAAMFAEERPALRPLPLEPFRYFQFGDRTVNLDGCVEVEAAYYGAPPGWIGRRIPVQWDRQQVRLLDPVTGQLLREHVRQQRGRHRIKDEDRPRRTPLGVHQLLSRAAKAGEHIGQLCHTMYGRQQQEAVRRILGVLNLAKKHGVAAVEDACAAALEMNVCEYRFVRRYLERRTAVPVSLRQVDPLIRQLTLYRDLIQQRTEEEPE